MMDDDLYSEIFSDSDATLITPNRRLSATLHNLYQHRQRDKNQSCWHTPDILPAINWIQRLWSHYTGSVFSSEPYLLNSAQEQFLWEKIIAESPHSTGLLQLSETADIAKSAWGLLKQWNIDLHHPVFNTAEDYIALQDWSLQFETYCAEKNGLDSVSLPDVLIKKIKAKKIKLPKKIILVGFTEVAPQLKQLLEACEAEKCTVIHFTGCAANNQVQKISLKDPENEILTMARFAKATLANHPSARIGCVIPSLEKIRDRVAQIFSEVFAKEPAYVLAQKACPFNISAGKSLLHYPIIHTALQILGLHKKSITTDTFSYLLASPFTGEAEMERIKRSLFDSQIRQANVNNIDLTTITQPQARLNVSKSCPRLAKRLDAFFELLKQQAAGSYSEWAVFFNQLLTAMGWPGERSLNSEEYQIVDSWLKLLADFTTLDQIAPAVSLYQALQTLQKMANKTIFQPKTPEAPIQVLGVLEAAGLPFDYLWVAGMDDVSWPPQPKPNPFIPKRLQRELQMPHATAERELLFCNLLIQQFIQFGKQVIFSHAEKNDELELQASPLIRDFASLSLQQLALPNYQTPCERIYATKIVSAIIDEIAPVVLKEATVRGGINVLKQQALCPFRSFAEWRLHAHALESPLPGLRPKDRGTLIHKALEMIWGELKDQASLLALSDHDLNALIEKKVSHVLQTTPHSRAEYKAYLALEKERMCQLLLGWLQIEKNRLPFRVILNEAASQIKLNQLNLAVRIDRVDELADGTKLIVDYKTGKNNDVADWFGDRLEEPQLPLYALLDPQKTTGITFAQIATGEYCFKGVSRDDLEIKGIKSLAEIRKATTTNWDEQITAWEKVLTQLSDDFCQGKAEVNPKNPQETCTWCALKPLCRIHEPLREDE